MYAELGSRFSDSVKHSAVGDDDGVRARFAEKSEIIFHKAQIGILCEYVRRNVYLFTKRVRVFHCGNQLVAREIVRERTQRKILSAYIHRVRTEVKCSFKFCKIAGRG